MTHVLFFSYDHTFLYVWHPCPARLLAEQIKAGMLPLPETYLGCVPRDESGRAILRVTVQEDVVIVSASVVAETVYNEVETEIWHLSLRQHEVLDCLAEGLSTRQIAHRLALTPRTVNWHIAAIKRRLNATTRAQSVDRAASLGLCRRHTAPSRKRLK